MVLAVLGIVMGLGAMSMTSLRATSLSTGTRQFADFVNLCRSQAIARHTAVRVGIVVDSQDQDEEFRRYSAWAWNKRSKRFEQFQEWRSLSRDLVFEARFPEYLKQSNHAQADVSSVRGDYVLESSRDEMTLEEQEVIRYFDFSPAGRASQEAGDLRNLILVLRAGEVNTSFTETNWSQFNIDSLTGRVRIYRP